MPPLLAENHVSAPEDALLQLLLPPHATHVFIIGNQVCILGFVLAAVAGWGTWADNAAACT